MHDGQAHARRSSSTWVLNRYYYQTRIPIKDAHHPLEVRGSRRSGACGSAASAITTATRRARAGSRSGCGSPRASGSTARRSRAAARVLPGVRFACDGYVELVRERTLRRGGRLVAHRVLRARPDVAGGSLAWEKHYPWVEPRRRSRTSARASPRARRDAAGGASTSSSRHATTRELQERCVAALIRKTEILWHLLDCVYAAYVEPAGAGRRPRVIARRRAAAPGRQGAAALRSQGSSATCCSIPERGLELNADGRRHRAAVHGRAHGRARSSSALAEQVRDAAARGASSARCWRSCSALAERGLVPERADDATATPRPYTLVAELTYRCPLRCVLLLEPARARAPRATSSTPTTGCASSARRRRSAWCSSTSPAASRCVRDDLEALVAAARGARPLHQPDHQRHPARRASGWRGSRRAGSTTCSCRSRTSTRRGVGPHRRPDAPSTRKLEVARWVQGAGPAAHAQRRPPPRATSTRVARDHRARRVASAPIGSSWPTRSTSAGRSSTATALLPTRAQLDRAREVARGRARAAARPDGSPVRARPTTTRTSRSACMDGWGAPLHRRHARRARRCPATRRTRCPGSTFENVRDRPLAEIWRDSPALQRVPRRGLDAGALPQLRRAASVDFGGCRCQAFHLTGDAAATDPACSLSPRHDLIETARAATADPPAELVFRSPRRPARA